MAGPAPGYLPGYAGSVLEPLSRLRGHVQSYRLRRRQALPAAGAECVFIVSSGLVAAENGADQSNRSIVELLYPGDIISSALMPLMPGITYMTMSASEAWRLSPASLRHEMAADATLSDYVFRQLNLQRARMQLHIMMLAGLTSEQRVAALLLQAAYRLGTAHGDSIAFDMPLSRNEVAEYLALNADTLSRIMSRLVRENVLQRSSRAQMTVRDMTALKAYCPMSDAVTALHAPA